MKREQLHNYELAEKIRQGDAIAFELLFKFHYKSLTQFAFVYLKNKDASEEIVQETFIKIWEIRTSINPEKSLKSFLYRCVHNNCINYLKKQLTVFRLEQEYRNEIINSLELWDSDNPDAYFDMISSEDNEIKIRKAIDSLPLQCREIFILCRFENLSYNQITLKLGISINTVKTQLQRAMDKIKKELINSDYKK